MYAYFESEFCQKIASCSDVLRASFAQGDLVGYGFPEGSCVVILERVARNPKGEVLEFRRMTAVASKVQFLLRINCGEVVHRNGSDIRYRPGACASGRSGRIFSDCRFPQRRTLKVGCR